MGTGIFDFPLSVLKDSRVYAVGILLRMMSYIFHI
jgi:hypothetical protein